MPEETGDVGAGLENNICDLIHGCFAGSDAVGIGLRSRCCDSKSGEEECKEEMELELHLGGWVDRTTVCGGASEVWTGAEIWRWMMRKVNSWKGELLIRSCVEEIRGATLFMFTLRSSPHKHKESVLDRECWGAGGEPRSHAHVNLGDIDFEMA